MLEFKLINSVPKTIMLGPVVIIELLFIRVLKLKLFENFRSNIITVFQKINLSN